MPGKPDLIQYVGHTGDQALGIIFANARLGGNTVRMKKSDPPDLRRETIRIFPDLLRRGISVQLVNAGKIGGSDPLPFQKNSKFTTI